MELEIIKTQTPKEKPKDDKNLGFGRIFTDHMLMMKYKAGLGWYEAQIKPFENLSLSPAALVLHYGQEIFEGMKAYRTKEGVVTMFRPWDNIDRFSDSARGLCMADFDKEFVLESLYELIRLEKDWIPTSEGTSLYVRPTYIGVDGVLGVKPASEYWMYVILSPSGAYYESGLEPVSIYVEKRHVRAVKGGIGAFKTGGNYAASLSAGEESHEHGYSQVLWLDGRENRYVEEIGSMNIFFKIDGVLYTPSLQGSILPGITRRSIITIAKDLGYEVRQKRLDIADICLAGASGKLEEAFGTGTAAVVSPIGELFYEGQTFKINNGEIGECTQKLYDTLTGIQSGKIKDKYGWVVKL